MNELWGGVQGSAEEPGAQKREAAVDVLTAWMQRLCFEPAIARFAGTNTQDA